MHEGGDVMEMLQARPGQGLRFSFLLLISCEGKELSVELSVELVVRHCENISSWSIRKTL
jgi:hypothetical protein